MPNTMKSVSLFQWNMKHWNPEKHTKELNFSNVTGHSVQLNNKILCFIIVSLDSETFLNLLSFGMILKFMCWVI